MRTLVCAALQPENCVLARQDLSWTRTAIQPRHDASADKLEALLKQRASGASQSWRAAPAKDLCDGLDRFASSSSLERLVGPEANDGQAERIDGQLVVFHAVAEDIGDAGGPLLAFEFRMVGRIGKEFLELDPRRIG
jgi:hypothetical protein